MLGHASGRQGRRRLDHEVGRAIGGPTEERQDHRTTERSRGAPAPAPTTPTTSVPAPCPSLHPGIVLNRPGTLPQLARAVAPILAGRFPTRPPAFMMLDRRSRPERKARSPVLAR